MKTYKELLEGWRESMSERDKAFDDLADEQRGHPENAMLKLAKTSGGGPYSHAVEHGGDLIHRMSEYTTSYNRGYEYVKEKVDSLHRRLNSPYGFDREHQENIVANAKYDNVDHETHRAKVLEAGKAYSAEHAKLPVYNKVQHHARSFAIALGHHDFNTARFYIGQLKNHIDKGEKHWTTVANEYNPNYEKNK